MDDSDKVTTDAGSTPLEPLALVAETSDSERSDLDSGGRGGLGSATLAEPDTTAPDIQYCTSIQHSYYYFRNIWAVEGSVLSALRRRL